MQFSRTRGAYSFDDTLVRLANGIGHFAHLYRALPEVFAHWERKESEMRDLLGDVSILSDRSDGPKRRLPLSMLRVRIDAGQEVDQYEIGGCGCFVDDESAGSQAGGAR